MSPPPSAVVRRIITRGFGPQLAAVAGAHNVTANEIAGRDRRRSVSAARGELWKKMRKAGLSLADIGLMFDRSNSSILFATSKGFRERHAAAGKARFAKRYLPKKAAIFAARAVMRAI